jgi:hypothetical protein
MHQNRNYGVSMKRLKKYLSSDFHKALNGYSAHPTTYTSKLKLSKTKVWFGLADLPWHTPSPYMATEVQLKGTVS